GVSREGVIVLREVFPRTTMYEDLDSATGTRRRKDVQHLVRVRTILNSGAMCEALASGLAQYRIAPDDFEGVADPPPLIEVTVQGFLGVVKIHTHLVMTVRYHRFIEPSGVARAIDGLLSSLARTRW